MEKTLTKEQQYILARKRVEKMSKFYKHLAAYLIVNTFLSAIFIASDIRNGTSFNDALFRGNNYQIWFYWGIAIALQAFIVFGVQVLFNKDWEQRKIKEYVDNQKTNR